MGEAEAARHFLCTTATESTCNVRRQQTSVKCATDTSLELSAPPTAQPRVAMPDDASVGPAVENSGLLYPLTLSAISPAKADTYHHRRTRRGQSGV